MTNTAFDSFVPAVHNQLENATLTPQQMLDNAVVKATTQGLSKEAFQEMFHKDISLGYDLQHHQVNLEWDFDSSSVSLAMDKKSFMLTFKGTF
jgi:hypothetical protein